MPKNLPVILCVDDEPINLAIMKHLLKKHFQVITCQSGKEALIIMKEHPFTDVISDFHMPEMNGIEFIEIATKKYPKINYHILTGYNHNDVIMDALQRNLIQNFFEKPFNKNEIINAVSPIKLEH